MGELQFVARLDDAAYSFLSGITDLEVFQNNGQVVLYALGVAQNGLSVFTLSAGQTATYFQDLSLPTRVSLVPLDMSVISLAGDPALCLEPWTATGVTTYGLGAQGQLGAASQIDGAAVLGPGLVQTVMMDGAGTDAWVFGGLWGTGGLARLTLDASGALIDSESIAGTAAEDVAALVQANPGSGDFLFSARLTGAAVTSWQIGAAGDLVQVASLGVTEGVGIAVPTALEFVDFAGESFLVLTASGSSSITVIAVSAAGGLELRDHVVDSLDTRFSNPEVLSVVSHLGRVYVLSGGSDDGINLFQMLPGGRLIHLESLADTDAMTLNNVSALRAVSMGDDIQIFVASGTETGLTQLSFTPDAPGDVLTGLTSATTGTGNADILAAGGGGVWLDGAGGNDILMDGTGSDTLTGGAGADLFVLTPDLVSDTILDFQPGIDRIDLGAYPMLRNVGQLQITATANGAILTYQGESLTIVTFDGAPLSAADFTTQALLPLTQSLPLSGAAYEAAMTGTSGNDVLIGNGLDNVLVGGEGNDGLYGLAGNDLLEGGSGKDKLVGGTGGDELKGRAGDDLLKGGPGTDRLVGGSGADTLKGGSGADRLIAGAGRDWIVGGAGNDILKGGRGKDKLMAGGGDDWLDGGEGSDVLKGGAGAGADTFVFSVGRDKIRDFSTTEDHLHLQTSLWAGNLTVPEVISQFARVGATGIIFDFSDTNILRLDGLSDLEAVANMIELI